MAQTWRERLAQRTGREADDPLTIGIVAPGVWRRRHRLNSLLGDDIRLVFGAGRRIDAIAGWGLKGRGRSLAEDRGLPYLALEDAFLAKIGGDEKLYGLLGLACDPDGIYYDATRPSFVEQLIEQAAAEPVPKSASSLRAMIRRHGLGKFNPLSDEALREAAVGSDFDTIVVDQIAGDLSIAGGLASSDDFRLMLEAALDQGPARRVAVKLHPYDGIGGRIGHLAPLAERYGLTVLPHTANWIRCAERAETVYVVSSNAGLEALIAGASVHCFGVPFFAGWGLTEDRQHVERRRARPSLDQLVHAVYEAYGSYWIPSLARRGSALELARFTAAQQRHARLFSRGLSISGVQKLKRGHIAPFVNPVGTLRVRPSLSVPPKPASGETAVWASRMLKTPGAPEAWAGTGALHAEDGFLRSAGLGADLVKPASLVFDRRGIYFDPSRPSDLEHLLQHRDLDADEIDRGGDLIRRLRTTGVSKYNTGQDRVERPAGGKPVILVPGQVENDASILRGSSAIRTNRDLLLAVRARRPDAFLAYKPHPDVEKAGRPGFVPDADEIADIVLADVRADAALAMCDEVHTITSLIGFEALIRGRKVVTYGSPFYAGWGLTEDLVPCPRRDRRRSLSELVYLTLVEYPLYVSPLNDRPCGPEDVIEALATARPASPSILGGRAALRLWRKARTMPDYFR